ncbi:iron dicitrate transport regulator FecR [Pseudomonas sp. RW407]|uniref:FecR domain-containing protein n=1 Tax=Pseudomonas sp. RW407 TaxID=2202894 RepID=UPI000D6F8900|nr:FecR domain-containing protein [Pseudomonas sp. RW407]PWU31397.1 iron dicitrate transport regulator FecR [Pseudomonas sp. RW407]
MSASAPLSSRTIDDAIDWAVKLQFGEPSEETLSAFQAWHASHTEHALAWQRVQSLGEDFRRVSPQLTLQVLEKLPAAGLSRRQALKLLILLGASAAPAWLAYREAPWQRLLAEYSTATGEVRHLELADGSRLVLNTDTAISTHFSPYERRVILRRGEVLVSTGADTTSPRRPFRLETPFGLLQAMDSRFCVRLYPACARVSISQGELSLLPANGGAPRQAQAGQDWWLRASLAEPTQARPFAEGAWAEGILAARDMRLVEFLDELGRYRVGRLACDPRVADLRVSGNYQLADTDQTLRFLARTQGLQLSYRTRFWVSVGPA